MKNMNAIFKYETIIYIDPGHGGFDPGAIGKDGSKEKDLTLEYSFLLKTYLEEAGFICLLTRMNDEALDKTKKGDIKARVDLINKSDCLLFVSIHMNAFPMESLFGAQTFYAKESNHLLALSIQESLMEDMGTKRIAKEINHIFLLDYTDKPGVICELGFMSNPKELAQLKDFSYQQKITYSVFKGIMNYLGR